MPFLESRGHSHDLVMTLRTLAEASTLIIFTIVQLHGVQHTPPTLTGSFFFRKRVIRIINKETFDAHTDPIIKDLKLAEKSMYLYKSGLFPKYFHNYFPLINEVHSYNIRSAKLFCLPSVIGRTNIRQFSIKYQGPNFFNTLNICSCSRVSTFNSQLRNYLLCYT